MSFDTKAHHDADGDSFVIESGGTFDIKSGGQVTADGAQAAAVPDFTGSTGGTADGALEDASTAVTGVDGTGSNAASKADVDSRLAAIANNLEELASDIDEIKAALRGAGLIAS